jgi:hypothetical protein
MFGINPCWFNWADSREATSNYWWQFVTWSTPGDSHHDPRLYGHFLLVDQKPQDIEQGLRLAYPDLDKRTVMIQTDSGFLVFRNGRKEQQSYRDKVDAEVREAQARMKKLTDLFAGGQTPDAYVKQQIETQGQAIQKIIEGLGEKKDVGLGQLSATRQELGKVSQALDDLYWRTKQGLMLAALPALKK